MIPRLSFPALLLLLHLSAGAQAQGYVPFKDSAVWKPATRLPARPGEGAPDFTVTDLISSRTMPLSSFKGQVVYLEFWATWCPACLPVMTKCEELAARRRKEWEGKVTLAGISLDREARTARRAARENGWKTVRQLWTPFDLSGREPVASKAFGIGGLPYAVLIDSSGTVVWRGDPLRHSAEEQIERLLGSAASPPRP